MNKVKSIKIKPIIEISPTLTYYSDKNRADNKVFCFELVWFAITFSTSIFKLLSLTASSGSFSDAIYFLAVFAIPILIRHAFRFDLFQTLRNYYGKIYIFCSYIANILFLSIIVFLLFALSNLFYLEENIFMLIIIWPFHIMVLFIGMYDKITMRMTPKIEEGK